MLNWLLSNIFWTILFSAFMIVLATYKSIKISKFLLKQNRYSKGNGRAKHFADRFIDCWKYKKGNNTGEQPYQSPNEVVSGYLLSEIDKQLEENNLIKINDNKIYPIVNLRNRFIIKILKFYLIHCVGDNKNEYNNL